MSSNPGDDMDACKCIVPLRHGGTRVVGGRGREAYSDEPVTQQPWSRRFLLARKLQNVQTRAKTEHYPYQGNSVQYQQHAVLHDPTER
ncbi:hypothetical protein TNCV_2126651 [Trichonephila clavipes]|nr:hypothetical protein TNCV_2126651 [Trichonephila clavipes]